MWYYWLIAIVALIICLSYIPLPLEIEYKFSAETKKNSLKIKVVHYAVVSDKKKKKKEKVENDSESQDLVEKERMGFSEFMKTISRVKGVLGELKGDITKVLNYLKKKLDCKVLKVHLVTGFDEAALTGMASGVAYGVVYGTAAMIYNTVGIKEMDIKVTPNFNRFCVDLYVKSIFTISFAHIIRVIFMLLRIFKKAKKIY